MRWAMFGAGLILAVVSLPAVLIAGVVTPVPEISASSVSTGLALLAGGILMLRARLGRK